MESVSTTCVSTPEAATGCGWSLKKSKHRKSQGARALKLQQQQQQLGALDDQYCHQQQLRRLDIENLALVDQQQHLRRLKPGRAADDADSPRSQSRRRQQQQLQDRDIVDNGLPSMPWDFSEQASHGLMLTGVREVQFSANAILAPLKLNSVHQNSSANRSFRKRLAEFAFLSPWKETVSAREFDAICLAKAQAGKGATAKKPHPKQSMRAAVESRRRLARGPRSGSTIADAPAGGQPMLPSEDHRVVSTDYQAARTQALMRVTLLAAGFVIGARGISARLIGQVTGAIVQSWTESCRPDSIPIRLFRIQGKKAVVQAAVALIEQAVAKYKDLCECKRRGEFVQREHVISGVEFYYQPPPRKAFANNGNEQSPKAEDGPGSQLNGPIGTAAPFPPHVWLQHLQQQQQQQVQAVAAAQLQKQQAHTSLLETAQVQVAPREKTGDCHGQDQGDISHQSRVFFDWQPQVERQLIGIQSPELEHPRECASEFELLDHGLQQSVASLEQALQQVRLEQRLLQHNRSISGNNSSNSNCITNNNDTSSVLHHQGQTFMNNHMENNSLWLDPNPEARVGQPAAAAPGFQLGPSLFFFGDGGLPVPISPSGDRSDGDSNCIFLDATTPCTPFDFPHCDFLRESLPNFSWANREMQDCNLYEASPLQEDTNDSLCIVCLDHPASVILAPCGHNLFCFSCVGGLLTCPLCRQPIAALHPRGTKPVTQDIVDIPNNLNASNYNMWNWIPGASV